MELCWSAIYKEYLYETIEEKMVHRKEMLEKGYTDTGLVSGVKPTSVDPYKRFPAGKYKKYLYKQHP